MAASEDECTYSVSLSPDSLAQIRKMLDPENLLGTGCKVEKHPGACARCVRNNDCDKIPLHPHCFPAGTVVSGPRPSASVIRWYSGELVEFETRSGAVVAATPNHPVLTAQGWVGAGLLNQGDQVVREGGSQGLIVSNPDEYQQPALIEDVARTVGEAGSVTTTRVPVTAIAFHGDGIDGDVAVIRADGLLERDVEASHGQVGGEAEFGRAGGNESVLAGLGSSTLQFEGLALAASRVLCGGGPGAALLRSAISGHQTVGLVAAPVIREFPQDAGDRTAVNAVVLREGLDGFAAAITLDEAIEVRRFPAGRRGSIVRKALNQSSYGLAADTVAIREGLEGLAGAVSLDDVIKIRRAPFNGHVYNLETRLGWYLANSIVVHNCRCRAVPYLTIGEGLGYPGT